MLTKTEEHNSQAAQVISWYVFGGRRMPTIFEIMFSDAAMTSYDGPILELQV